MIGIEAKNTNLLIWGFFYGSDNESCCLLGPNHTENMEVCKNANFEEIQNLFNVPQRLIMDHPAETLNVSTVGCTSLSWQRSTLSHDQVITKTKAKVHVYGDSASCLEKISEHSEANFNSPILMQNYLELTEGRLSLSGQIPQGLLHWKCSRMSRQTCEVEVLNQKNIEIESFFVSLFNDIDWTKKGNSEKCISNFNQIKNYKERFSQGHLTFLGPGHEKRWYGTLGYKPDVKWDSAASSMVQRFAETGHPMFKGISALSRGILKRKQNGDTIHFNTDSLITELWFRIIHSANQLSIYGAVSRWCEEFGQKSNETETSVKFEKTEQTLKEVRQEGPHPKG